MKFLKKQLSLVVFITFVYIAYAFVHFPLQTNTTPAKNVLGITSNLTLFEQPSDGRQPLLTAMNNAQHEILVEMYLLSDKQMIHALEQAKARGVTVQVMIEQHPFGGGNNEKTEQELQQAGIHVEWTNPAFTLTHEKDVIVDRQEVFVMTQNLTTAAFEKNREYDIIDTNRQDVQEAGQIFLDDWDRQSFASKNGQLVVSPVNARQTLTSLLQGATQAISIEMEEINDPQIIQLLINKAKTIHITIITPTSKQLAANAESIHALEQAGATVKSLSSPYIHAKLILVDNAKAYIGSINLSSQSMDQNRELGIIISQSAILNRLQTQFNQDFQQAIPYQ